MVLRDPEKAGNRLTNNLHPEIRAHVSSKAIATTMGTKIRVSANQGT